MCYFHYESWLSFPPSQVCIYIYIFLLQSSDVVASVLLLETLFPASVWLCLFDHAWTSFGDKWAFPTIHSHQRVQCMLTLLVLGFCKRSIACFSIPPDLVRPLGCLPACLPGLPLHASLPSSLHPDLLASLGVPMGNASSRARAVRLTFLNVFFKTRCVVQEDTV